MVIGRNKDRRSVQISVLDVPNSSKGNIGNTTIPVNYPIPKEGDLVEIEYLYCYPGGALYQPVYKGVRDDKDTPDSYYTLKFKQEEKDA